MHIFLFLFLLLIFDGTPSRHARGHTQWIDRSTEDAKSISYSNVQSTLTGTWNPYRKSVVYFFFKTDPIFFSILAKSSKSWKGPLNLFRSSTVEPVNACMRLQVGMCVCVQTVKENGVSGTDRLFLRFMPLSVKFPSASKVNPGSHHLLPSLWFSFILPSSHLFSFLSFFLSFYVLLSFLCSVIHSIRRINTIFSSPIICFRLFVRQIIQSFYWKQQKHLFFYFGIRPLEIFTHPTKSKWKIPPPICLPSGFKQ